MRISFTVANILTVARLFVAPVFLVLLLSDTHVTTVIAVILFFLGAISDYFDGYLARKYGEVTSQGEFLDPLADKVLTTAAFVAFYLMDIMPLWMVIIIVVRDFGTTAMRSFASDSGTSMKTSKSAKLKTFLQMAFISYVLTLVLVEQTFGGVSTAWAQAQLHAEYLYIMMLIITLFTLYTLVEYAVQNRRLFRHG